MEYKNSLDYIAANYEKKLVDVASTTVTYLGFALDKGTATSAAKWVVYKITQTSATPPEGVITFEWAVQIGYAQNIWDNRGSLSYVS